MDERTRFRRKKSGSTPKSLAPGDIADWLKVQEGLKSSRVSAAALVFNKLVDGL